MDEMKRTAIITIRTTTQLKEELEEEARRRHWSLSQYVESILNETVDDTEEHEEEIVMQIIHLLDNGELKDMNDILRWSIQNHCLNEVQRSGYILSLITGEAKDD